MGIHRGDFLAIAMVVRKDRHTKPIFKIGERIYEGLQPGEHQHPFNALVAMITLMLYGEFCHAG